MTQLDRIEWQLAYLTGWVEGLAVVMGVYIVVTVGVNLAKVLGDL